MGMGGASMFTNFRGFQSPPHFSPPSMLSHLFLFRWSKDVRGWGCAVRVQEPMSGSAKYRIVVIPDSIDATCCRCLVVVQAVIAIL